MQLLRRSLRDFCRKGDLFLFILCLLANLFGLLLIFSATRYAPGLQNALSKQAVASLLGALCFLIFTFINIEYLVERFAPILFGLSLLLLLLLVPFGNDDGTGNKSWIILPGTPFNLQPAELVKLSFVLLLALQLCRQQKKGSVSSPLSIFQTAGHTLLLCAIIFLVSSDMGMVLVYFFLFLLMAWTAGVRLFWFLSGLLAASLGGFFLWPYLPSYIQMRFLVVFDHGLDPQGKGFQQMRSLLAIGSGQTSGQGYLQGIQTQSSASSSLPARHTDFIFSVAGEEFGLLGCLLILALLTAIVLRCLWISRMANSRFGSYVAIGYGGMLAVQALSNIGMCLFVAPVVGLTLPFFSYGGSSIITLYIAMGILSNIKLRSYHVRA